METAKKVVCCVGNPYLCHVAEAYLRYFSQGRIIVSYLEPNHREIHPSIRQILLEDGINWEDFFPRVVTVSKQPDYYFVFGPAPALTSVDGVPVIRHENLHLSLGKLQNGAAREVERYREEVKKAVLKFIGKEL